jgi:hypothetical protein
VDAGPLDASGIDARIDATVGDTAYVHVGTSSGGSVRASVVVTRSDGRFVTGGEVLSGSSLEFNAEGGDVVHAKLLGSSNELVTFLDVQPGDHVSIYDPALVEPGDQSLFQLVLGFDPVPDAVEYLVYFRCPVFRASDDLSGVPQLFFVFRTCVDGGGALRGAVFAISADGVIAASELAIPVAATSELVEYVVSGWAPPPLGDVEVNRPVGTRGTPLHVQVKANGLTMLTLVVEGDDVGPQRRRYRMPVLADTYEEIIVSTAAPAVVEDLEVGTTERSWRVSAEELLAGIDLTASGHGGVPYATFYEAFSSIDTRALVVWEDEPSLPGAKENVITVIRMGSWVITGPQELRSPIFLDLHQLKDAIGDVLDSEPLPTVYRVAVDQGPGYSELIATYGDAAKDALYLEAEPRWNEITVRRSRLRSGGWPLDPGARTLLIPPTMTWSLP